VTQVVSGAAITLVANAISAEAPVTLTVRDAVGQTASVAVTVKPSPLLGELSVTQTTNSTCAGASSNLVDKAAICSGESGVASITIRSAATSVLPNRQIRFDVVQGAYNFLVDQNGTIAAKTITIVTDQNGKADAVVRIDAGVPSQSALIRATDVTSGNRVDSAFSIVQAIGGSAVLSVVPNKYEATGYYENECPGTSGNFLVFGGSAPYSIRSALPNAVGLSVGGITSDPVTVAQSGGSFTATSYASSGCGGFEAQIAITDAAGRVTTVSYTTKPGTNKRETPGPSLSPPSATITASAGTCDTQQRTFTSSGSAPFTWSVSDALKVDLAPAGNKAVVTGKAAFLVGQTVVVAVTDKDSKPATAEVKCVAP
jgi:hypothetical protein